MKGQLILLRPTNENDRELFYRWATSSDATPFWYGDDVGEPIPDQKAFFEDFTDPYFDGSKASEMGSYVIQVIETGEEIGQINYQHEEDDPQEFVFEFDILIADKKHFSKGYGSEAMNLMMDHLGATYKAIAFVLSTLPTNLRAIHAYQKSGFKIIREYKDKNGITWVKMKKNQTH